MSEHYNLFLDDLRNPSDVKWIELPSVVWTIVRNYKEFINIIEKMGVPYMISFDHDICPEHYAEYTKAHEMGEQRIRYEIFQEKTGYDCAKWIANLCVNKGVPLPLYYIHTLNPIGEANIFSTMESARKIIEVR